MVCLPDEFVFIVAELDAVLKNGDVLKVDIGVHVKGRILDSAFTMTFDPDYEKLLEAVRAATDTGVRVSRFQKIKEKA
jgi:methionine aminopeptidase